MIMLRIATVPFWRMSCENKSPIADVFRTADQTTPISLPAILKNLHRQLETVSHSAFEAITKAIIKLYFLMLCIAPSWKAHKKKPPLMVKYRLIYRPLAVQIPPVLYAYGGMWMKEGERHTDQLILSLTRLLQLWTHRYWLWGRGPHSHWTS